jgi:hypothetical protein
MCQITAKIYKQLCRQHFRKLTTFGQTPFWTHCGCSMLMCCESKLTACVLQTSLALMALQKSTLFLSTFGSSGNRISSICLLSRVHFVLDGRPLAAGKNSSVSRGVLYFFFFLTTPSCSLLISLGLSALCCAEHYMPILSYRSSNRMHGSTVLGGGRGVSKEFHNYFYILIFVSVF